MVEQLVLTGIMLTLVGCLFGTRINPAWLFVSAIGTGYLTGLIDLESMLVNYAKPFTIKLVDVPISVMVPPNIAVYDSGNSSFEGE